MTRAIYLRDWYIPRAVAVPLSMLRRNGAADTTMGATATANKDGMEGRMFYVLSSPNKKVFVVKKCISLLSAREDAKNGHGRDLAALRYLR